MNDKLQNFSKFTKSVPLGILVIVVFFFLFFFINLLISVKGRHESAYTVLSKESEKSQPKLQDTRVHNWSELDKMN